jgi:hypothetical protein
VLQLSSGAEGQSGSATAWWPEHKALVAPRALRRGLQDEQRLELLKEIGGTRVYEDRRRESFRVMEECQAKRTHIQDLVGTRLAALPRQPAVHGSGQAEGSQQGAALTARSQVGARNQSFLPPCSLPLPTCCPPDRPAGREAG